MNLLLRTAAFLLSAYLSACASASVQYRISADPWEVAGRRNGLAIVTMDADGVWMLPPWNNWADDWLPLINTRKPSAEPFTLDDLAAQLAQNGVN